MGDGACDDEIVFILARPGVVEIDPKSKQEFRVKSPEAEFLDEIQTKVLRVFLLAIQSTVYRFA
jgi:hypothetical protein